MRVDINIHGMNTNPQTLQLVYKAVTDGAMFGLMSSEKSICIFDPTSLLSIWFDAYEEAGFKYQDMDDFYNGVKIGLVGHEIFLNWNQLNANLPLIGRLKKYLQKQQAQIDQQ